MSAVSQCLKSGVESADVCGLVCKLSHRLRLTLDISKDGSKGICVTKMSTILLLLIVTPMLLCTSDSFHIEDIECICSGTSAVCGGISNDEDEIQELLSQLLQNCSSTNDLLDLTLNIENLDHLPEYPFAAFKLQNLTLGYGLSVLNSNAFDGLNSSLLSLNLSHNDIEFFGTPLSVLENLKELNLDFNNLREDDVSAFGNLNKLEVLSISGNNLTGLNANFFENMTAIQTLILDHNENITSFLNISIISSTLITLSAKNCSIKGSLESDSLSGIANLKHADFSSNNLIRVNAFALDRLHYLETLKLSNNKIETLKNYSFSSLHNLLVLDLKGNVIKEIEEFSFVNLTKLKILDLSENKLEVFMEKYTSDLHSLEKINLEDNQIHVIMPGSFSTCGQLKELLLQGLPKEGAGGTRGLVIRAGRDFIQEVLGVRGVRMPVLCPGALRPHGLALGSPTFVVVIGNLLTVEKARVSFSQESHSYPSHPFAS
ncbi:hypothetical protein AVEN_185699-1 [Araneus ventricosus]|uniref:Insulin-like growth factor-binding protein complex acid labile subunit n=1 Tax=Araneus ventricosus TaxID=182803 RepID=A0A4Y2SPI5_ARAVE|nr:hypothetical protein AVEN_185699-1 [Araneus ventricosus]